MPLNRTTLAVVVLVAATAGAIVASAAFLYLGRGSTGSDTPAAAPAASATVASPPSPPTAQMNGKASLTMQEAADRLSLRLMTQGGSADDWALLARSFVELRQYPDAVHAFEEALKKSPNDAQLRQDADRARKAASGTPAVR